MTLREEFAESHPDFPLLCEGDREGIARFLTERGWLEAGERVQTCSRAGEGNMNLTLRIETQTRSFILKQARPWVERYDHIPAPWQRSAFERRFYEQVRDIPGVADRMPALLHADAEARVLVLEDLRDARDFTGVYSGERIAALEIEALAAYLTRLHEATRADERDFSRLVNREMRTLNHEHLFEVPLADANGIDLEALEPGLAEAATRLRDDPGYRKLVSQTAARYLADGTCLVHGDYFPGSWLRTSAGLRIIDPEFAFPGDPEVDVGCALAHFALSGQPLETAESFRNAYAAELDSTWVARYAGIEVMRRLIGVAQLPLPARHATDASFRASLLGRSREAMLSGDVGALWAGVR